jgi:hypothetical protein
MLQYVVRRVFLTGVYAVGVVDQSFFHGLEIRDGTPDVKLRDNFVQKMLFHFCADIILNKVNKNIKDTACFARDK